MGRYELKARRGRPIRPRVEEEEDDEFDFEDSFSPKMVRRNGNKIYFYAEVSIKSALEFNTVLDDAVTESLVTAAKTGGEAQPIWVYIHSYGGDAYAGISMMDSIRSARVPVKTVVDGFCASAATFVLMGSKDRYMRRHASVLIHQIRTSFWGKFDELMDEIANSKELMSLLKRIYSEDTKITRTKLDTLLSKELYMNADECKRYDIIRTIL